jgi:hypothetical protein
MNQVASVLVESPTLPTLVDTPETNLSHEIGELWQTHSQAQTSLNKSREELKAIRTQLSQKLHALKTVLARPGRAGEWSGFLQAQNIPRSTADRLVRNHEKALATGTGNCTAEQIPESTEVIVRRYLQGLWPRLSKVLTTREAVNLFITELTKTAEVSFSSDTEAPSSSVAEAMAV